MSETESAGAAVPMGEPPRRGRTLFIAIGIAALVAIGVGFTLGHMDRLNAQIHSLHADLGAASDAKDKATADLKTAQDALVAAQADLKTANDKAGTLSDQVTSLEGELDTAKTALAAAQDEAAKARQMAKAVPTAAPATTAPPPKKK